MFKTKEARAAYLRAYYQRNRTKLRAQGQAYFRERYRERNRLKCRAYYQTHRQELLAAGRRYQLAHREQKQATDQAYARRHRVIRNGQLRHRYHHELNYKLAVTLRSRLTNALHSTTKAGSAIRDLGCTLTDFRHYVERHFLPGMTWENHGKEADHWHLDHIRPLTSFDLTQRDQWLEACHFTNLQPLWRYDNLKKGATYAG